jgi:hypothetical protein
MHRLKHIAATRIHITSETTVKEVSNRIEYPIVPGKLEGSLLPHQIVHTANLDNILNTRDSAADCSKPGRGKTHAACAILRRRRLPAMIWCPKSMITTWYRTLTRWGIPIISITNYDMARTSHSDSVVKWYDMRNGFTNVATVCPWIRKRRIFNQKEEFEFIASFPYQVGMIVDEEHTGKNTHTQTFSLLKALMKCGKKEGHKSLYLTATPIEKKVNLKSILFFLGYVTKPDMNAVNSFFRKKIGTTNMDDIHSFLYNKEKSVSSMPEPEYPKGVTNDVKALTYKMDDEKAARIAAINEEIIMARRGLALKQSDNSIGLMNGNRQLGEKEKIEKFVELTIEALQEYPRVGIFVTYKNTLFTIREQLLDYLDEDQISVIHGDISNEDCDREAAKYVAGESRVMICTIKKGGQSLSFHDVKGGLDTFVIISPPTSATDIAQCSGRHFRTGSMSRVVQRIVFTEGDPIEESIRTALNRKLDEILTLTTGQASNFNLYDLAE